MPTVKDPVCGMDLDSDGAAGTETHHGKEYYFCSPACHEKFKANPKRYASS